MRCEEVRSLLPQYVGEGEDYPRAVQAHLATCTVCALEEARYKGLLAAVRELRDEGEVPVGFADRALETLRREIAWRRRVRRVRNDPRARAAAVGLGGAVVGAAAIAYLLRRGVRRRAGLRAA